MRSYSNQMLHSPRLREYITSERYLHDSIVTFVDDLAERMRQLAQEGMLLKPLLLFWVDGEVRGDDGALITGRVVMELESTEGVEAHMRQGVERVKAYAVMLFRPEKETLSLELETPHGAETWLMERQQRGDVYLVLPPVRKSGTRIFGVIQSRLN